MKTIIVFAMVVAVSVVLFQSPLRAQVPDAPRQPVKAAPLDKIVYLSCPDQVPTAVAAVPAGWSVADGPEAREKFLSVAITNKGGKPSIGCIYGNQGQYGAFVLSRTMPANYECKVENAKVRNVTCRLRTVAK